MFKSLHDYANPDLSGEAQLAAARMEARAKERASQAMFEQLVAPLLSSDIKTILEFGCGTAALARKLAQAAPQARVYAGDKSEGMLKAARHAVETEAIGNVCLEHWDVLDEQAWPIPESQIDLIISSVVIPYFDDAQTVALIKRLSARLSPNGVLAFLEQDLTTDTANFPKFVVLRGVLAKDARHLKRTLALGLRPILRKAGLQVLPRQSFLWTDDEYGEYARDLLERLSDSACDQGRILEEEKDAWKKTLNDLAASGDFYYGIVYHLIAGKRIMSK